MSTPKNRIVLDQEKKSLFPSAKSVVTSVVSFNQGDLLVFDVTNHRLKLPAAETEGSTFVGMAEVTVVNGKIKSPYVTDVDASQGASDLPGPVYSVVVKVIAKTGDAFNPGDLVYLNPTAGAQNVSSAGTKAIGNYQGDIVAAAAAGQEILVKIGARHPGDALQY